MWAVNGRPRSNISLVEKVFVSSALRILFLIALLLWVKGGTSDVLYVGHRRIAVFSTGTKVQMRNFKSKLQVSCTRRNKLA